MSEQTVPQIIPITNPQIKDITGQRFGRLVVFGYAGKKFYGNSKKGKSQWLCQCDCGNTCVVILDSLQNGVTTSCGCFRAEKSNQPVGDLTGVRCNRLVVIRYNGNGRWVCRCDCGNETRVRTYYLVRGKVTSCGCLNTKHGMFNTTEYKTWANMLDRCYNTNCRHYKNYGGRGITVCDRWRDFKSFYEDMGDRPGKGYSLDRIDNSRGYEKSNCRWTTIDYQANNRRGNHMVTFNDETHTLSEWSRIVNIEFHVLFNRLSNMGWSVEKSFTTPVRKRVTLKK